MCRHYGATSSPQHLASRLLLVSAWCCCCRRQNGRVAADGTVQAGVGAHQYQPGRAVSYITTHVLDQLPPTGNPDLHAKPLQAHGDFYIVPSTHVCESSSISCCGGGGGASALLVLCCVGCVGSGGFAANRERTGKSLEWCERKLHTLSAFGTACMMHDVAVCLVVGANVHQQLSAFVGCALRLPTCPRVRLRENDPSHHPLCAAGMLVCWHACMPAFVSPGNDGCGHSYRQPTQPRGSRWRPSAPTSRTSSSFGERG
jgi:hypothetical protein